MTVPSAVADIESTNVATANCALTTAPAETNAQPPASTSNDDAPHGARLLLISHNDELGGDLVLIAQVVGFDCDVCEHHQALEVLHSNHYDAAVFDVVAPENDFALIEEARCASKTRQIPIIALTDATDANRAFRSGASFALARPLSADLLKNTVAALYRIAVGQRRQYARYRVELPLTLTVNGSPMDAKATDLGHGGMALVTPDPLEPGAIVSARFVLPGSEETIIAAGEIRWSDHHGRAGLCFSSIAGVGRSALDNWIARRHAGMADPSPRPATSPSPRPPLVVEAQPADATRRTSTAALTVILAAFCLFVVGFWIYVAMTS